MLTLPRGVRWDAKAATIVQVRSSFLEDVIVPGLRYDRYGYLTESSYRARGSSCYSTGIIERSIFDLIQDNSVRNAPAKLVFAEGLITAIPKDEDSLPVVPSTPTKSDFERWNDL